MTSASAPQTSQKDFAGGLMRVQAEHAQSVVGFGLGFFLDILSYSSLSLRISSTAAGTDSFLTLIRACFAILTV